MSLQIGWDVFVGGKTNGGGAPTGARDTGAGAVTAVKTAPRGVGGAAVLVSDWWLCWGGVVPAGRPPPAPAQHAKQ